jgi:hypothetical protein
MKNSIYLLISILFLACSKESSTTSAANPFDSSKIASGKANISCSSTGAEIFGFETNVASSVAINSGGYIQITGISPNANPNYSFTLEFPNSFTTGDYLNSGIRLTTAPYVNFTLKNNISGKEYKSQFSTYNQMTMKSELYNDFVLKITKKSGNYIEGTFSSTSMYSSGFAKVEVINGKFAANIN